MNLLDRLPSFYKESKEVFNIQESLDRERMELEENIKILVDELFINTSKNISNWEEFLGISVDDSQDINFRKEKIKANIIGTGTFNKKLINDILSQFKNSEGEVTENNSISSFIIKFNNEYTIPKEEVIKEIINIMRIVKPAHLDFNHTFTYKWWNYNLIKTKTWGNAGNWGSLRKYEEE